MFFQNIITLILRGPLHVLSGRHWIGCLSTPLLLHLLLSHLVCFFYDHDDYQDGGHDGGHDDDDHIRNNRGALWLSDGKLAGQASDNYMC